MVNREKKKQHDYSGTHGIYYFYMFTSVFNGGVLSVNDFNWLKRGMMKKNVFV